MLRKYEEIKCKRYRRDEKDEKYRGVVCIKKYEKFIYVFVIGVMLLCLYRNRIRQANWFGLEKNLFKVYIPRIKLQEDVYDINSSLNNVDYHIEILEQSRLEDDLYFLAGHSGSGYGSYFDDLVYLEKGDLIELSGDEKKVFVVEEMFYVKKNGFLNVVYNSGNKGCLILITCSLDYVGRQLIVKAKML